MQKLPLEKALQLHAKLRTSAQAAVFVVAHHSFAQQTAWNERHSDHVGLVIASGVAPPTGDILLRAAWMPILAAAQGQRESGGQQQDQLGQCLETGQQVGSSTAAVT